MPGVRLERRGIPRARSRARARCGLVGTWEVVRGHWATRAARRTSVRDKEEGQGLARALKRGWGSCRREEKLREGRGHRLEGEGGARPFLPNKCLLKCLKEKRKEINARVGQGR